MTPLPDITFDSAAIVSEFLNIIMIPDPAGARRVVSPEIRVRFTGGRAMTDIAECAAFNATRHGWVRKRIERSEVVAGATRAEAVVYRLGMLHDEWPDGVSFKGKRYIDRYVVRDGLITQMNMWDDSAEWLLVRAGLATP